MGINLVVAVTDDDWFEMLRRQPNLSEVNFWAPSAANFRALQPGEMFLFKLHAPRNVIVGGGIFAYANALPCSLAWTAFGEANGARSAQEMRARIARYRRTDPSDRSDFEIGCRILTQPFFFEEADWIPVPPSWSPNIVSFKTYNTSRCRGLGLVGSGRRPSWPVSIGGHGRGGCALWRAAPHSAAPRTGSIPGACDGYLSAALRGHPGADAAGLEAAHIRPYGDGGAHEARNGLLLRRDIHSLFDAGYVTVTPDLRFEVSRRIREEFENGRHYYALHGHKIEPPLDIGQRPDPDALAWHNEHCFRG